LLVAIVVIAILVEASTTMSSVTMRREREAELLFRGQLYRNAIKSYFDAGTGTKSYPRSLTDLLVDPRYPKRHHIRELYGDPMSRDEQRAWILIRAPDGGIAGVASSSQEEPMRKENFPRGMEYFSTAKSYSDWKFSYEPGVPQLVPKSSSPFLSSDSIQ